jgi:pimeloyl-ACP methyl ester carboxylesterase
VSGPADPIDVSGVAFSEHRITVEEGVSLRILEWTPQSDNGPPVFFVAGWVSVVEGWRPLLEELVACRRVVYVETREKASAEISAARLEAASFTIQRLADDLAAVAAHFGLDDGEAVLFGSSMGSNAILEVLKHDRLRARAAFLIGPNAEFRFPPWGRLAVRVVSPALVERLKGFVIWYLRRFRVNAREDPAQMARYQRTVRAADPLRLKLSALAVLDYSALPGLETISTPVAVAYAASDVLHGEEEARRIVELMPRGEAIACPSNTYMHTAAVIEEFDQFAAGLGAAQEDS